MQILGQIFCSIVNFLRVDLTNNNMMRFLLFTASLIIALIVSAKANILSEDIAFDQTKVNSIIDERDNSPKTVVTLEGLDTYVTSDYVSIPYKVITIEVPLLSKSFEINEVIPHYCKTITYNYPLQSVEFDSTSELFGMRVESSILKVMESKQIEIIDEYIMDNIHYIKIALTPIKYDLNKGEIYVYDNLRFKIKYAECTEDELEYNIDHSFDNKKNKIDLSCRSKQYIIITTDTFKSICEDIALWKKEQGYDCNVVCVKEILSNPDFAIGDDTGIIDEAEAIRQYLLSIYSQNEMYCLFVGDTNKDMPFRYFYQSSDRIEKYGDIHNDNFIPSDLYFSDLSRKWRLEEEESGINSIPLSQITYSPNIYVGRIICATESELRDYFNKLLVYESFPGRGDDKYLDTALVFQQSQHIGYTNIVETIGNFQTVVKFQDNRNYNFDSSSPTGQDIIKNLRRCGLSSWQGHGNPGSVACSGKNEDGKNWRYIKSRNNYSGSSMWLSDLEQNNALDLMDNVNYPSVVYSLSCNIAPFDDCYDMHLRYNMGTSFTVGGSYGGVALLGNSRTGWDSANIELEKFFANYVLDHTIGKAHALAKKESNITNKYALAAHNIIGDPSLYIWLGKPKRFNLSFSQTGNIFNVHDSNLQGASIVLFDGNNMILSKSISSNLNINTLDLLNEIDDKIQLISVFKRNYLPELILLGQNFTLKDCSKKFICKNAYLGRDVLEGKEAGNAIIGENCNLNIRSIDSVDLEEGFVIESNGNVQVSCEGSVELTGVDVKDGGFLNINGQNVVLKEGTKIEQGAVLKINVE